MKPIEVSASEEFYEDDDSEMNNNGSKKAASNSKTKTVASAPPAKSGGGIFASFKSLVGNKVLIKESIEPVMEKMQEHLVCK